jgi:hypothetical protein
MFMARRSVRRVLVPIWCKRIIPSLKRRNSSKNSNKSIPLFLRRTRKRAIVSLVARLGTMLESV